MRRSTRRSRSTSIGDGFQEQDMGEEWSLAEVDTFLKGFHQHGPMFNRLSKSLPDRSPKMVEAFFTCNKILIQSAGITPEIIHNAIQDRYATSPRLGAAATIKRAVPSNKRAKRHETHLVKQEPDDEDEGEDDYDEEEYDEEDDEEDDGVKSKRRLTFDAPGTFGAMPKSPFAGLENLSAAVAAAAEAEAEQVHHKVGDQLTHFLQGVPPKRRLKKNKSEMDVDRAVPLSGELYCGYNWFCSQVDSGFFRHNRFLDTLSTQLNFHDPPPLTRHEWGAVRRLLRRNRRFSAKFIESERQRLYAYRDDVRMLREQRKPQHQQVHGVPILEVPQVLQQGAVVTVFIPEERTLCEGRVMGSTRDQYQVDLGTERGIRWVEDTMVDSTTHSSRLSVDPSESMWEGLSSPLVSPRGQLSLGNFLPVTPPTEVYLPQEPESMLPVSEVDIQRATQLTRVNERKAVVLELLGRVHGAAGQLSEPPGAGWKEVYSELLAMLRKLNQEGAPLCRHSMNPRPPGEGENEGDWLARLTTRSQDEALHDIGVALEGGHLSGEQMTLVQNAVALAHQIDHTTENMFVFLPSESKQSLEQALTSLQPIAGGAEAITAYEKIRSTVDELLALLEN